MNEENPSTDATFDRLLGELKEQCRRKPRHPIDSTAYRIRDGRTIPAKEKE